MNSIKVRILYGLISVLTVFCLALSGQIGGQVSSGSGGSSCSQGDTLDSDGFESLTDGAEWSTQGWYDSADPGSLFIGDNAVKNGGSISGKVAALSTSNINRINYQIFATGASLTEKSTHEIYFRSDDVSVTGVNSQIRFGWGSSYMDTGQILWLEARGDTLYYMDNTTLRSIKTIASDTWYLIEVEVDADVAAGTDCVRIWVDNVEITYADGSAYDTNERKDPGPPGGIDTIRIDSNGGARAAVWFDDWKSYAGARCYGH